MREPRTIYLNEYKAPDYVVDKVDLNFDLDLEKTRVTCEIYLVAKAGSSVRLDGENIKLVSVAVNGQPLASSGYNVDDDGLTINSVPAQCCLRVISETNPLENSELSGLYVSNGKFFTQCEAEGFRRITYFPDRPDVLTRYRVTLTANKEQFPVLLSNGNLVDRGDNENGTHWVCWEDPFPKPSYLFALVAGDLSCVEDSFETCSGRTIALKMYVDHGDEDNCLHALASLKRAMRWDEEAYGREYDLDIYMVVAVSDFNMGAMENKGLNIFNSKYVLASVDTATDQDYQAIESIIGHEYFHNWSGNRVTCRDWFQLSLKEGFTVFRDQEFTSDLHSRGVKRISDVNILRTQQFREDSGPASHPVRPDHYIEINNFYTVTIYNKGAEVVRMQRNLLGEKTFRKGTDEYFSRFDGKAVTTDDFVSVMAEVGNIDLTQFKLWYSQSGTPVVKAQCTYTRNARRYTLRTQQHCPATPGQREKRPFVIPFTVAFFDSTSGSRLSFRRNAQDPWQEEATLQLTGAEDVFDFEFLQAASDVVPSLLRGFSAPVKLETNLDESSRYFLWSNDDDEFNRWEAGQHIAIEVLTTLQLDSAHAVPKKFIEGFRRNLESTEINRLFQAQLLRLPDESYLSEFASPIDPQAIHDACRTVRKALASELGDAFLKTYHNHSVVGAYSLDPAAMGRRAVRSICLAYLVELGDSSHVELAFKQYKTSNNMTDRIAALSVLANLPCDRRVEALEDFYAKWRDNPLVLDKWFSVQAASRLEDTVESVKALQAHPAFTLKNPNRVRSLLGVLCFGNPANFHRTDGAGYELISDAILRIDRLNPQLSARMVSSFAQWRQFEPQRRARMESILKDMYSSANLSKDLYEMLTRFLKTESD